MIIDEGDEGYEEFVCGDPRSEKEISFNLFGLSMEDQKYKDNHRLTTKKFICDLGSDCPYCKLKYDYKVVWKAMYGAEHPKKDTTFVLVKKLTDQSKTKDHLSEFARLMMGK